MISDIIIALSDFITSAENIKTVMYDIIDVDYDGSTIPLPLASYYINSTDVPDEVIPGNYIVTQLGIDLFYKSNAAEKSLKSLQERSTIQTRIIEILSGMSLRNYITSQVDGFAGFENISMENKYEREALGSENKAYRFLILLNCRYKNFG